MISQRCPEFQRQWGPSGATEGGRELILAVSLHSLASLHYIISKRPCVPSYHLRQDCTRTLGVQLPLGTLSLPLSLSLFLLLYPPSSPFLRLSFATFSTVLSGPTFRSPFHARLRAFCPVPFSSLTTIFAFVGRKRGRWMNRRCAQGRGASRRRTPATGFGGQTGDRVSRESRSTIHFYPALFFLFLSLSFFPFILSFFLSLSPLQPRCSTWRESKHSRSRLADDYTGERGGGGNES